MAEESKLMASVREFHTTYGVPLQNHPALPSSNRRCMRQAILNEEWNEYCEAERNDDLVEIADALADMVYVIAGTAHEYGIPLDAVLAEVHRSNMSKLDESGEPILREDGKVLKGPNFFTPDIAKLLGVTRMF